MVSITIPAPAKINLVLKVLGRRPDGYHEVVMLMEKLKLHDEITVSPAPSLELVIDGSSDAGMEAQKNLAWRAADALRRAAHIDQGARIVLTKRIPIAAGLGGGSSDAASTLIALNRLWGIDWPRSRLAEIGAQIGADVPFFCFEGAALVEGIGEKVAPLPNLPKLFILLINPGFAVSTPWVYRQWDRLHEAGARLPVEGGGEPGETNHESRVTNHGLVRLTVQRPGDRVPPLFEAVGDIADALINDLEEATIPEYPVIGEIKALLTEAGAAGAMMSGSGPTVLGLFDSHEGRDRAMHKVVRDGWRIIATEN